MTRRRRVGDMGVRSTVPLDCSLGWVPLLGAPWAFSRRCREAYDLDDARFPLPPAPLAPPVPDGGDRGAVTDPNAADDLVARSMARVRQAYLDFFSSPSKFPDDPAPSLLPYALAAAGLLLVGVYLGKGK